jgi:hypothetical protein
MSERKAAEKIENEEIIRQRQIAQRIRQNNEIERLKTGKQKQMHVITFGCQQNESDSEKILGMLSEMGYTHTDKKEEADVIIINTCCVRDMVETIPTIISSICSVIDGQASEIISLSAFLLRRNHSVFIVYLIFKDPFYTMKTIITQINSSGDKK